MSLKSKNNILGERLSQFKKQMIDHIIYASYLICFENIIHRQNDILFNHKIYDFALQNYNYYIFKHELWNA